MPASQSQASIAYGSINNFDTVNDAGVPCHGFEIELDDTASTDITYTYDWNHYGTPIITEDTASNPGHTNVIVRYVATYDVNNGTWSAYTAVPTNTIAPTDGHMFTDPSINFGGEHFGVGFYNNPSAIHYSWLLDDGTGQLILGPQVQVATPTFVYYPPVAAAPGIPPVPPKVQAAIKPPPPPLAAVAGPPPVQKEFGEPVWVKEIRTTSHGTNEVKLRDLVSDDPNDSHDRNWRNGEPDEVELEWQLMQTEFARTNGGANGELQAAAETLNNKHEIVTRRYEFYKYRGPMDNETGEALADNVGADGIHGTGSRSNLVVVGDFIGSQMSAVDVSQRLGLIDHLNNGEVGVPYVPRTVVISGAYRFTATNSGALPAGLTFDEFTGIISGTPQESGVFTYTLGVTDGVDSLVKTYVFTIADSGVQLPPQELVELAFTPAAAGSVSGGGLFNQGSSVSVTATTAPGYAFLNWTENGRVVSTEETYTFDSSVNRALVAHFFPGNVIRGTASPARGGTVSGGGGFPFGVVTNVTLTATPSAGYTFIDWTEHGVEVSTNDAVTLISTTNHVLFANFLGQAAVNVSVDVPGGGTVTGAGNYGPGENVTLTATENPGYQFWGWTVQETGDIVGYDYTLSVVTDTVTNLVANFWPLANLITMASPPEGGTTSGDALYWQGDTAYIQAVANPGYTFTDWTVDGVEVSVSASDYFVMNTNTTLVANFAPPSTNQPPVANPDIVQRWPNLGLNIKIADLLTNDTDADGDPITLTDVSALSDNNMPLTYDATTIFYPASSNNVPDQFTYTIRDGQGGAATGVVTVAIRNDVWAKLPVNLVKLQPNKITTRFWGVPGFKYVMQRSTNMVNWVDVRTNNAPNSGALDMEDAYDDLEGRTAPPAAYYRVRLAP